MGDHDLAPPGPVRLVVEIERNRLAVAEGDWSRQHGAQPHQLEPRLTFRQRQRAVGNRQGKFGAIDREVESRDDLSQLPVEVDGFFSDGDSVVAIGIDPLPDLLKRRDLSQIQDVNQADRLRQNFDPEVLVGRKVAQGVRCRRAGTAHTEQDGAKCQGKQKANAHRV